MTYPHTVPVSRRLLSTGAALAAMLAVGAGCAAKNKEVVSENVKESIKPAPVAKAPEPTPEPVEEKETFDTSFGPIFYALDSAQLLPESTQTLQRLADYLRANPGKSVTILGHTCELGTSEYNMALGQKRAHAARQYLIQLGANGKLVDTLSYGEERPAAYGGTESAYSQNRRSEFDFQINDGRRAGR